MTPARVVRRSARLATREDISERPIASPPLTKYQSRTKKAEISKSSDTCKQTKTPTKPKTASPLIGPTSTFANSPTLALALQHFTKVDPKLAAFMQTVAPPSTFADMVPTSSQRVFRALVRSIIYQQIH
ncbi:hypothetical protein IWQ61_010267, partial [Dispira simplex]